MVSSKGYVEMETSLALLELEGGTFQGSLKSGGFCGTFVSTGKGFVERETSLALLKRDGSTSQSSLCSPLKIGGFLALLCAPVRGM